MTRIKVCSALLVAAGLGLYSCKDEAVPEPKGEAGSSSAGAAGVNQPDAAEGGAAGAAAPSGGAAGVASMSEQGLAGASTSDGGAASSEPFMFTGKCDIGEIVQSCRREGGGAPCIDFTAEVSAERRAELCKSIPESPAVLVDEACNLSDILGACVFAAAPGERRNYATAFGLSQCTGTWCPGPPKPQLMGCELLLWCMCESNTFGPIYKSNGGCLLQKTFVTDLRSEKGDAAAEAYCNETLVEDNFGGICKSLG